MPEQADSTKIMLGRGKIFFDLMDSSYAKTGEFFLGNCTTFEVTASPEEIKKYDSTTKAAGLLASDTVRTAMSVNIVGDEFSKENLSRALYGDLATLSQTGDDVVDEAVVALLQDRYYALAYRSVTNVVVKGDGGTPTYVLGTDYTVDAVSGRIYIKSGGSIAADTELDVSYTYATIALDLVRGMTQSAIRGFIRFKGDPARGPVLEMLLWRVSVRADGSIGLISDEYGSWSLTGDVESDAVNHPDDPHYQIMEI
jgi:hypothetical protein